MIQVKLMARNSLETRKYLAHMRVAKRGESGYSSLGARVLATYSLCVAAPQTTWCNFGREQDERTDRVERPRSVSTSTNVRSSACVAAPSR